MKSTTHGLTGLAQHQNISAATQELSHLPGVTGVTIKVVPNGISLVTITGTSIPPEAEVAEALRTAGCELQPIAAA
ncbi:MAG: heavy metal transporter [Actinobacteria bacterium]|nr:heavy metal transporter [Actinomycetota bacterium]